jgi:hypothetical protein
LVVAEHRLEHDHHIKFKNTQNPLPNSATWTDLSGRQSSWSSTSTI